MEQVSLPSQAKLTAAIGPWVGRSELRAILERRDRMQQDIARLVKDRGESVIFK